jgi:hypothetical protein
MKKNRYVLLVLFLYASVNNVQAQVGQIIGDVLGGIGAFMEGVADSYSSTSNTKYSRPRNVAGYQYPYEVEPTKRLIKEADGFLWYELRKEGGFYGIGNSKGKEILEPGYSTICYDTNIKTFRVRNKDKCHEGILSLKGKWIIPLERKYSFILYSTEEGVYKVEKGGYKGVCSIKGKEIIPPDKYVDVALFEEGFCYKDSLGNWIKLNIDKNGKKIRVR